MAQRTPHAFSIQPDAFAVPELAISTFEKIHGLRVTIHDLAGSLTPVLPQDRFQHIHPICLSHRFATPQRCIAFDCTVLRRELVNAPFGRVQVCYAGLVEYVVPVFRRNALEWVIFAGAQRPGADLTIAARSENRLARLDGRIAKLPSVGNENAQLILESLRQLAARLERWSTETAKHGLTDSHTRTAAARGPAMNDFATRRTRILHLIHNRHTTPITIADIAADLGVCHSRAAHIIKQVCGQPLSALLLKARLNTAATLLSNSGLSIVNVCVRSGFNDLSYFHRRFRRKFKLSPLQYRKRNQAV